MQKCCENVQTHHNNNISTFSNFFGESKEIQSKLQSIVLTLCSGPILSTRGLGAFFWGTFFQKKAFYLLAPSKQILFLTIYNENIFVKNHGTRLGAIVALNKVLE